MAETTAPAKKQGARKTLTGYVTSNKMNKTIVVEVTRQKSHAMYLRVIKRSKKYYAHDEQNSAHIGDVVKIEETRPLSALKRWKLVEILKRAALVPGETAKTAANVETEAQA
jgi:small subunit ribosomal protein S17